MEISCRHDSYGCSGVTAHTRHLLDSTSPALCPYCQEGDETQEHRMSVCDHFQEIRRRWGIEEFVMRLPKVTQACGIQLKHDGLEPIDLMRIQGCQLEISLKAMCQDKGIQESRQDEVPTPELLDTWMRHAKVRKLMRDRNREEESEDEDESDPIIIATAGDMHDDGERDDDDEHCDAMDVAGHRVL